MRRAALLDFACLRSKRYMSKTEQKRRWRMSLAMLLLLLLLQRHMSRPRRNSFMSLQKYRWRLNRIMVVIISDASFRGTYHTTGFS